ncbi:male sterility protein [Diaporthe amygdali]|uniref:male sterility protein n=1 Tax=Phomopsis amygdali TaxID=1214568 RepID=UPI0022FEC309|nr:male sterility protein [Diaporthe amygdali]KAJ0119622.1 male sterility protein [Diaporthe amygdali]
MAVATQKMPALPLDVGLKPTESGPNGEQDSQVVTITDLLLSKVRETPDAVFIQYPATAKGKSDYVGYTVTDVDRLADEAARQYAAQGLRPELVVGNGFKTAAEQIKEQYPLSSYNIIEKSEYDLKSPSGPRFPYTRPTNASQQISFIVHSSGSTGLPKPIYQTHSACLANYSSGIPYRAFLMLPLFHNHGISVTFRGLIAGKKISMYNANLPLAGSTLIESLKATQPQSLHCVPYALKLMAETAGGIEELKKLSLVMYGGSSCPDDLGDRLTEAGVYVVGQYGTTETGQLMTSFRDPDDKGWNYMRPFPVTKKFIKMVPIGADTFECVVLDGLPSKTTSNSDDPPNSYHTRDTFTPHPTIPDAWRYLGRLDDRVTLVNGEKVLPIPYEHTIRQHDLVQEAVVFGVEKAVPGLMVIPSDKAASLSKEEILQALLPKIELANSRAEEFGRISQEMIEILDAGTEYPRTDKGTVIRAAFYKQFAKQIDDTYDRFAAPQASLLALEHDELVKYLLNIFRVNLGIANLEPTTDFFEGGIDSRQAITARAQITRELDVGGNTVGSNVIFEYPNVELLAKHLNSLRTGVAEEADDEISAMAQLIEKYSNFHAREPGTFQPDGEAVLLTGATGSLGVNILAQLLRKRTVKKVFCLVRASTKDAAKARVISTLEGKGISSLTVEDMSRVSFLPADLSRPDLGLEEGNLDGILRSLTLVIHSAWAVNFNLGVRSFESQHIRGAHNLINICLRTKTVDPARFYFCSSISSAAATPLPATIGECHIENLSHAQAMGYARSKLVTEHIIKAAGDRTGMTASVLRVGQIVGDTTHGSWNTTEAIPLMIQSAKTIGALPALEETPSWMPVDLVAQAVIELSGVDSADGGHFPKSEVYNVQNNRLFHWTRDLLPALKEAGLDFKIVSQRKWVDLLRKSDQNPETNPTIKLVDFFAQKYDNDKPGRSGLKFATQKAEAESEAMRNGFDVVGSGLVRTMVAWMESQW